MATTDELLAEANITVHETLAASAKWFNRPARKALNSARIIIEGLAIRLRDQVHKTERAEDAAQQNERLNHRITLAIRELRKDKRNRKTEEPFAIILSPYQYERLTWWHGGNPRGIPKRFMNVPIFTAKGVYGPLVLTKDAFDGFTRQAPELMILAK